MRAHQQQQIEGLIGLLRQVPRSVWIAVAVTALLFLVALAGVAVVAVQWLLGQDTALIGQAAAWLGLASEGVPAALQQVEAVVPGVVEPVRQAVPGMAEQLDRLIPGAGAHLEQAAGVAGTLGQDASAEAAE
ncbi:MAG: hypothetical protein ACLGHJ_04105 [Gammaproteobacteria bacterium]